MDPVVHVLLWWLAFAGSHMLLSHRPVRSALVGRVGQGPFLGLYSLVAFATFVPLVWAYLAGRVTRSAALPDLLAVPGMAWATTLLMAIAFVMLVLGFAVPNPTVVGGRGGEARGILRVTRHPTFVSFALFGLAHLLVNRNPVDVAFFGGFAVYSIIGALHQDSRKLAGADESMRVFYQQTSLVPFGAILSGRNRLELREMSPTASLVGIALFVIVLSVHHRLFG